jgi:hypothetical protein
MSDSIYYELRGHSGDALKKYDPFEEEPLLRLIDPIPTSRTPNPGEWKTCAWRTLVLFSLLMLPTVLFAILQPSHGFNRFHGDKNGLGGMIGFSLGGMYFVWACYLVLILLGRRLCGALLLKLEKSQVVSASKSEKWHLLPRNRILTFIEPMVRLNKKNSIIWIVILVLLNAWLGEWFKLHSGIARWCADPATRGTFFYFANSGTVQPNWAGIWHLCIASAVGGYLILLLVRLYVVFACISDMLARDETLHILPTHPDQTGGLLPVGQTALFMSGAVFVSGLGLAAIFADSHFNHYPLESYFWVLCITYLTLGPLLFVLPLLPLRSAMIEAKHSYLENAERTFHLIGKQDKELLTKHSFHPLTLQGHVALASLIEAASEMTVWPFDRRTLRRFVGALISPLSPIIVHYLAPHVPWLEDLLRALGAN